MHFHFGLDLTLLWHIGLNCLTSLSSYHCGGPLSGHFWSLGYHLTVAWVYLLSMNLATCTAQLNFFFQYSMITSFTSLHFPIMSLWMNSHNNIPSLDLSIALCVITSVSSSFFVVAYFSRAYKSQAKWNNWRDWYVGSSSALPFIMINALILFSVRFPHPSINE